GGLHRLGPPDLAGPAPLVDRDGRVVGHVLGLERGDADAAAVQPPADARRHHALAGIGVGAGHEQAITHGAARSAGSSGPTAATGGPGRDRRTAPGWPHRPPWTVGPPARRRGRSARALRRAAAGPRSVRSRRCARRGVPRARPPSPPRTAPRWGWGAGCRR